MTREVVTRELRRCGAARGPGVHSSQAPMRLRLTAWGKLESEGAISDVMHMINNRLSFKIAILCANVEIVKN